MPKDGGSKLVFTTGGEAGTYYGFGSVLAQKFSDVTSTSVTAICRNCRTGCTSACSASS